MARCQHCFLPLFWSVALKDVQIHVATIDQTGRKGCGSWGGGDGLGSTVEVKLAHAARWSMPDQADPK